MDTDTKKTQRKQRQEGRWKPGPAAAKRQARVLEELATGASVDAATAVAGVSRSAFYQWCRRDPAFKAQADRLRMGPQTKAEPFSFGAEFRSKYLIRSTPDHQGQMDELINSLGPREWGLILAPAEHLKTTETEDYLTWAITQNPNIRTLVISKTEGHAKSVLGVVKDRLTDFDTHEALVQDFGPFKGNRSWTAKKFTVAGRTSGERDATCEAMGLNGSPFGHRVDVMVLDDLIDLTNAENVDAQVEWIERIADTRLTKNGIVIVVGSRIREHDLYNAMLESGWIHKSLILPAIVREPGELGEDDPGESLWPDEWPVEALIEKRERMKDKRSWLLSYQQKKLQAADAVFPLSMIESCFDARLAKPSVRMDNTVSVVGVDPGLAKVTAAFTINLDRTTKTRHWANLRTVTNIGEGGDVQEALINFIVETVKANRATTCVVEGNSAFQLLTSSRVLRDRLKELYCALIVVTSEGDGLTAADKWRADRPELTYESLAPLFANQSYKIPASAGAQKFFRPVIDQFEGFPGGKRTPKDILSAARLAEFGCLAVLDQYDPPAQKKGYAEAIAQLERTRDERRIPAYVTNPYRKQLKNKVLAERNARLWGPDGHFTKRLPRRGANQQETETA